MSEDIATDDTQTHTAEDQSSLGEIGTAGIVENQHAAGSEPAKTARKPKLVQQKRRLTGADIRKMRDIQTEEVWVEDWKGLVTIKALSAKERDDFEDSVLRRSGKKGEREFTNKNIRAKLVVRCLINPDFSRMYTDADAEWLGDKNAKAINTLYEHCAVLSGITQADESEMEKNSLNGDGGASE